jgi:predicted nucleic acid-binding protein
LSYLLDTCIISELIKPKPEPALVEWLGGQAEDRLYLSVLTLGEIEKGIAKLTDSKRIEKLEAWLEDLRRRFEGRWLEVSLEVGRKWGRIQGEAERAGRKFPAIDGLIAATALHFGCTIVTRNVADLAASGAKIFDPWAIRSGTPST